MDGIVTWGRFEHFFTKESKLPSFVFKYLKSDPDILNEYELIVKETVGEYTFFEKTKDKYLLSFCKLYAILSDDFSHVEVILPKNDCKGLENDISYLLMQAYMFRLVLNNDLMIHSAVAVYNNYGILFCGASGAGKSTQANLWKKYLGASILNYDKPCIIKDNDKYIVHGSPWSGKEALYKNEFVPIKAIVFVNKAKQIKIEKLSVGQAYGTLFLHNYVYPFDKEIETKYAEVIRNISQNVPVYNLFCDISKDSVSALYNLLFDEKPYFDIRKGKSMKYKVNKNFQMNKIADEYIVIPRGNLALDFNATVVFNESGAYLWELLRDYIEIEELSVKLSQKYSISKEEAIKDIDVFIKKMIENNLLEVIDE